jgi:hypothetical protein
MLNFTNILRITMGGQPFLPLCGAPPADPDGGGEMANEGDGGTTGGGQPTGGTTGGQQPPPDDNQPPPDGSLCANNGGIQWQGTACVCPGVIDNVTMCADGTKIDQVTQQTCTPDAACDQPTDPQNPPAACACTFVCTQSAMVAVGQCSQGVGSTATATPASHSRAVTQTRKPGKSAAAVQSTGCVALLSSRNLRRISLHNGLGQRPHDGCIDDSADKP